VVRQLVREQGETGIRRVSISIAALLARHGLSSNAA
jgi:hypothetical protein